MLLGGYMVSIISLKFMGGLLNMVKKRCVCCGRCSFSGINYISVTYKGIMRDCCDDCFKNPNKKPMEEFI